jgi:hypothetical protein
MSSLPPPQAPLYNHPLPALEQWLRDLGAVQHAPHSCLWDLALGGWNAQIELEFEDLTIRWQSDSAPVERHFPYGLSRADVEAAILAGP